MDLVPLLYAPCFTPMSHYCLSQQHTPTIITIMQEGTWDLDADLVSHNVTKKCNVTFQYVDRDPYRQEAFC